MDIIYFYCCVCGRVKVNGVWTNQYVEKKKQSSCSSHGYCPKHLAEMYEKLEKKWKI